MDEVKERMRIYGIEDPMRERYLNDPKTHSMVRTLQSWLRGDLVSPGDLARMVVLAATIEAEENYAPVTIRIEEARRG